MRITSSASDVLQSFTPDPSLVQLAPAPVAGFGGGFIGNGGGDGIDILEPTVPGGEKPDPILPRPDVPKSDVEWMRHERNGFPTTALLPLKETAPEARIDSALMALSGNIEVKARYYQKRANETESPALRDYYSNLFLAMALNRNELKERGDWSNLPREDKLELYNRIRREMEIEIRHNVSLSSGSATWTQNELYSVDQALERLPERLGIANPGLRRIVREKESAHGTLNDPRGAEYDNLEKKISVFDNAKGNFVTTDDGKFLDALSVTMLHEIGHSLDDEDPKWESFKKISGWRDLGAQNEQRFAIISHLDKHKGSDIGITDEPDVVFRVTKKQGRVGAFYDSEYTKFVSDYAKQTPFEDFAEAFRLYLTNPSFLRNKSIERFNHIDELARATHR